MPFTPDLYGLPDHQWTGRRRRTMFRKRRVDHWLDQESAKAEADRLRVALLPEAIAMTPPDTAT